MTKPIRLVIIVAVVVAAAVSFHMSSGRVLHWLKAMHGGAGQSLHGSR